MRTSRSLAPLLVVLLLGAAACGSDDDASATASGGSDTTEAPSGGDYGGGAAKKPAGSSGSAISMKDFAFAPGTTEVKAGATVTVTNDDGVEHTWTADDGSWDESVAAGESAEHVFDEAGSFAYHCEIHPSMTGTVEVS